MRIGVPRRRRRRREYFFLANDVAIVAERGARRHRVNSHSVVDAGSTLPSTGVQSFDIRLGVGGNFDL